MIKKSKKNFVLLVLLIGINKTLFAKQLDIKDQQEFFCQLEKYDQCFYSGACNYKDYVNYTDYFIQITQDINQNAKDLYDNIPKIYKWTRYEKYFDTFQQYLVFNGYYVDKLAESYIKLKFKWLSWYKNTTGISYKNPVDIFSKNNKMCGAKIFKKYLSLPLPEDADVETCFFNYEIDDPWCKPDDKLLMRNLFCKSGKNCEIRW